MLAGSATGVFGWASVNAGAVPKWDTQVLAVR